MNRKKVSTVIISDVHVGSEHSKVNELISFLHSIDCEKLILNGDILDGWKLHRNPFGRWKREYTDLIKVIMKMMEKHNTRVIYVRRNHGQFFLEQYIASYIVVCFFCSGLYTCISWETLLCDSRRCV